jgi:ATP-dependent Clp protease adaptor protein ClpS
MSTALDTQTVTKLKTPSLFKVVFLNDDFTPMDFVIQVLNEIYNKSEAEAYAITVAVHQTGRGVVGTYTKEIAEQKVYETKMAAMTYQHPLKAIVELA